MELQGFVATVDGDGRTMLVGDAHCRDGERFIVRADEELTASLGAGGSQIDQRGTVGQTLKRVDAFFRSIGEHLTFFGYTAARDVIWEKDG